MRASNIFYNQQALQSIQPFIRNANQLNSKRIDCNERIVDSYKSIVQFPIRLTNRSEKGRNIKFYQKYLGINIFKQLFTNTVRGISQLSKQNTSHPTQLQNVQPFMLSKIRQYLSIHHSVLDVKDIQIKSTQIITNNVFKGAFMHRSLNMPAQCYSVEVPDERHVIFRMRKKMQNALHVTMLSQKKKLYNSNDYQLQRYYLDSYQNFMKNQKIIRILLQVNAIISGKFTTKQGTQVELPTDKVNPTTTHVLQVQKIEVPGRSDKELCLVTDIDYFMEGNPFAL